MGKYKLLNYKKIALLLIIAGVVISAIVFIMDHRKPFDLENVKSEAMLFSSKETDLLKIGKDAINHYFSSFMGKDIPKEYRITKYKINDISLMAGDEKEFCLQVISDYSTTGLYFLSANGRFIPNAAGGDCEDDCTEFRIKSLENDKYLIVSIGTGGCDRGLIPVNQDEHKKFVEDKINIIISSPLGISNIQYYIDAHKAEYDAILALDANALPYMFKEFEKGEQTGLKGSIMVKLCRQILGEEDIKYASLSPQDWYNTLKEHMQALATKNSLEFVQKNYPKASLILNEYNYYYGFDTVNFSDGQVEIAGQKLSYEKTDLESLCKTLTYKQIEQMMYRAVIFYKGCYEKDFMTVKRFSSTELKNEIDKWTKNEKTTHGVEMLMQLDNYTGVAFPIGIAAPIQHDKKYVVVLNLDKTTTAHITFEIYREGTPQVVDFDVVFTNLLK